MLFGSILSDLFLQVVSMVYSIVIAEFRLLQSCFVALQAYINGAAV